MILLFCLLAFQPVFSKLMTEEELLNATPPLRKGVSTTTTSARGINRDSDQLSKTQMDTLLREKRTTHATFGKSLEFDALPRTTSSPNGAPPTVVHSERTAPPSLRKSLELGETEKTVATTTTTTTRKLADGEIEILEIDDSRKEKGQSQHTSITTTKSSQVIGELIPKDSERGIQVTGPQIDLKPLPIPLDKGVRRPSGENVDFPVDDTPRKRVEECYSGFSVVNGETVATGTEKCPNMGDYCYNATVSGPMIGQVGKAGCSETRCQLAGAINRCVDIEYLGYKVHFCCCDGFNLCNSKYTNLNVIEAGLEKIKDGIKFVDKILDVVG